MPNNKPSSHISQAYQTGGSKSFRNIYFTSDYSNNKKITNSAKFNFMLAYLSHNGYIRQIIYVEGV